MQHLSHALGGVRVFAVLAMALGMFAVMAPAASANHEQFGVCHATGSETNPFTYISPDRSSGHLNTDENPAGPSHEDDRAATHAEFDDQACVGQTEFPTEAPETEVPATEAPETEVPATKALVDVLPETGTGTTGVTGSNNLLLAVGILLLAVAAVSVRLVSGRTR